MVALSNLNRQNGWRPLAVPKNCAIFPPPFKLQSRHEVTVKVLIDAGSDIEVKNSHEETALDCAVREGRLGAVKVLLDHGALIENKDDVSHSTALHVAAKNGYDAIVRLLLSRGATIDRRDEDSHTALDLAVMEGYRGVAQVLVEAEDWQKIMAPKDVLPLGRHSDERSTPMRYLISDFPDVAKIVLSKCVEEDGEKSDPFYRVSYNFSLIDDTYMMPSKDGTVLIGERSPYHGGKLKKGAKTYSENYDVVYENHPLKLMADAEKLSLLSHPLVLGLLKYKWNSLGRYVYYLALMVYVAFLCLLTLFITYTPAPFNVYDETSNEMIDLSALLSDGNATCPDTKIIRPSWLVTVKWAVISLGIAQLIKEFFQFITRRLRYITLDNAIECFVYSSAIVIVVDLSPCSHQTGLRMNWQWSLAAICAFASWMNLLLLIRKLPKFGIYVVMFFDVLKTFSRFFLIFVLFIVAFSVAFHAILQNRPEFSSVPSSVLKTAVMMIGEFEFTAIFHGDDNSHLERLFGPTIAYPLFLFFCVIMTILLMNLLVGLAVDDIKSVQEKAELKRLSMQVSTFDTWCKQDYPPRKSDQEREASVNILLAPSGRHLS
ncbi:ankyrin repeat protein [Ancylostoma caninum]|uniref:Ankyrin repeat protein n=1 Tax=Ancylostoma caninum TaxID=29170 RepID=A0A368G0S1_ANCCA|nr:ankyrin repeat protein [Ancylostoma caninum]